MNLKWSMLFSFFAVFGLTAQNTDQDSTGTGHSFGQIELADPPSIVGKYTYDPILDRYVYSESVGNVPISYPLILTSEEYEEMVLREQMRDYFKQKSDAMAGRKEGSEEEQKNLLPIFYVNSGFFQSIFGGDEIEIIPQGSVEMDLGIMYTKQDNPSLSPRNRSSFTFDFDQRINLSLLGKIGKRLQVTANYDTESTFDFQNQIKLEYTPTEDDIVRKIEVGNVSMPLNSTLIQGAQSLFGAKVELQFGKTSITGVYAEQNSERQTVQIQGGGTIQEFEKFILDYEEYRHFFLSHYFRDHYDEALRNYPFINSNVQITRVEVWVTNRSNNTESLTSARNIVAIQDLGESEPTNVGILLNENGDYAPSPEYSGFLNTSGGAYPDNSNNDFNPFGINGGEPTALTPAIRDVATIQQGFGAYSDDVNEGVDYVKLENARQLLPSEYTLNAQLGYISLNQRLTNDEILAVAFQFTVNGQVYQVGEFANDGVQATETTPNPTNPENQTINNQSLVVKMLKSSITNVNEPVWDIMMKNIYGLGAYQLEQEDFRLKILYTDPQPLNYIKPVDGASPLPEDVAETNLLQVFSLDHLNRNNDPIANGDGFFDYVPGITIDPENGRIIFTTVEPFGGYLFDKLDPDPNAGTEDYDNPATYNANQEKYVFRALYETTKVQAQQESAEKNKFQLKGSYKSSGQDGIPIGAFNVPQGSVTVTAGGRVLQEGVDYTVNYQLGRVKILDDALMASNVPIQVSTENNAMFGQQTKRFSGVHVEHKFSDKLLIGGTYLNLNERPVTQKANYSYEPINNSIFGFNINYSTEVPFLTRMVNKLPNIDTDVESNFSLRGEFAYLQPGAPKGTDFGGVATTYIDDFEASQTSISVMSSMSWELSSVPVGYRGPNDTNGNYDVNDDLSINDYRAKLAWYTIDPIFYSSQRPGGISDDDLSNYTARRVFVNEIFPNTDIAQGQTQAIYTLDLSYFPQERGQYNYNPMAATSGGVLPNPEDNFGGIIREMTTTDFERSNVEFVEFWIMDPFIYDENADIEEGTIVFNFGSISEDVLKDGRKQYENGLPSDGGPLNTTLTNFAKIPSNQSLIYAFDSEGQERQNQDVGYDGFDDADEATNFPAFAGLNDPSNDNYTYYLNTEGDIVERYKFYNGSEGNSPTEVTQTNRGNSTYPTVEDVNKDNTMNTIDSYFQYKVPIFRNMGVNNNTSSVPGISDDYITDVKEITVTMQNGEQLPVRWVQFKVPLRRSSEYAIGGISDLRSVRFMRMFLTDFEKDVVLRFGTMDLVRGDYRRYTEAILPDGSDPEINTSTVLEVAAVSEEETSDYISPPGVVREEFINNNEAIREDEQSMSVKVKNLEPGDSRGVYKNFQVDMRQYKNLEMFLHAEALPQPSPQVQDGELIAYIRMGTDFTDNFYQIEIPLKVSAGNASTATQVWPAENELKLPLELLQKIKSLVIGSNNFSSGELNFFDANLQPANGNTTDAMRVGIKGNPSFGSIRMVMLGLKNNSGADVSGEVWFNEMRLSDLKNQGGWAAILSMDTNLADFATISATGRQSTVGFGSLEQGPNQRSREDIQQYDVVTSMNLGQLLPKNWGIKVPVNYSRGEKLITPQYDPEFLDIELETLLENTTNEARRDALEERAQDYTRNQSVSIIGLRKDRTGDAKPMPYDIENFAFSGTYNQIDHRDFEIEESMDQDVNVGATYNFNFKPLVLEPFKKIGFLEKSSYFDLFKDFNVNFLPTNLSASSNIIRQYNEQQFREINRNLGDIGLPTLYQRNFLFNWQYTINYNLTESLSFNFNSSNNRIVRNYMFENNVPNPEIGLWDGFFDVGDPDQHYQSLQVNYDLPFDKIPALKFIKAQYSYTGNFQWQKGSQILNDLEGIPNIGNSVQNSSTHQINGTLEMSTLYNYIGLEKKKNNTRNLKSAESRTDARNQGGKEDNSSLSLKKEVNETEDTAASNLNGGEKVFNSFVGIVSAIKRIQVDYQETQGTFLPGYTRDVGFAGTMKPTLGFTFGSQRDVREEAARNGWLTLYQEYNEQYLETESRQLNLQASIGLLPDLTIDLNANRMYLETYTENYRVDMGNLEYHSLTPNAFGNFNISTILIQTAFASSTKESSETFQNFRDNRLEVAQRLARKAGINLNDPNNIDQVTGFPKGYGRNSQAVLLPAFLAAYSGQSAGSVNLGAFRDVPLPNWNLKYTGLMRLDWFKNTFNRFSLQHGYTAGYTINRFQSNLEYDRIAPYSSSNMDQSGNFRSDFLFSNVNLVEQFSPLIKVDFEMKNTVQVLMEIQKDRMLSLSFDNNLLTEIQGNEYILGLGYRIQDLKIATTIAGNRQILSSDLTFKADVSYRKNRTFIRYLDVDNSQTTAGQDIWTINFEVKYDLTKNLSALFYYDHSFSEYAISTAFPQTTIRSGITLRYNFGN